MQVWVTRTEPSASRLADTLTRAGFQCLVEPVIEVVATDVAPPTDQTDLAIYLSAHAVRFAALKTPVSELASKSIAIGPVTQHELAEHAVEAILPDSYNSKGIYRLLRELRSGCKLNSALVVRGTGKSQFQSWQIGDLRMDLLEWQVYSRHPTSITKSRRNELAQCDITLIESSTTLEQVSRLHNDNLGTGRESKVIVVPSKRLLEEASERGYAHVEQASGTDAEAIKKTLARLMVIK